MLFNAAMGGRRGRTMSRRLWSALWLYDWPGNIHELTDAFAPVRAGPQAAGRAALRASDLSEEAQHRLIRRFPELLGRHAPPGTAAASPVVVAQPLTFARAVDELARRHGGLAPRQVQVVALLSEGKSCKSIAGTLDLDYRTVSEHIHRACAAVQAKDREDLVGRVCAVLLELANGSGESCKCGADREWMTRPDSPKCAQSRSERFE